MAEKPGPSSAATAQPISAVTVTEEVSNVQPVFEDRHVKEIGLIKEIMMERESNINEDEQNLINIKLVGPPVEYSASDNEIRLPPPRLGQHTDEILTEVLNYSNERIEKLRRSGDIE